MLLAVIASSAFAFISKENLEDDPKSKALIKALAKVNGGWEKLSSMKDVEFTYTYHELAKGKDISTERYVFSDETSWAKYSQHDIHVMPGSKGMVSQSLMNGKAAISLEGKAVDDMKAIGGTAFLRSANYYWFTMMYKLDDPGTIHKYLGQEMMNGVNYDKVSLSYDAVAINKEVNDEYILYFNPKTSLVDQIMFSLPVMGVNKPILKMTFEYTKIEGIQVSTKRVISAPDANGKYSEGTIQYTTGVKFNNKFTASDLKI